MTIKQIFSKVAKVAKNTDCTAYVVGGYVRDEILGGMNRKDIDIVVAGSGVKFAEDFDKELKQKGSLVLFAEFDTARYVIDDLEIEFAGARSESYDSSSRKPSVKPASIETDLSRRDFTVNAMAREIKSRSFGAIIDPFDGQSDLKNKILRTPLKPDETFFDDPLRMMRAARFAAQLEFKISDDTYNSIVRNYRRLEIVSSERILQELMKLLSARTPSVGLWILVDTGLMGLFFPEIIALRGVDELYGQSHKDNLTHTFQVVDNIAQYSDKVLLRFAGLLHDIAKPQTKKFVQGRGWTFDMHEHLGKKMVFDISRRLKMSRDDSKYIAELVRWHLQPIALMDEGITDSAVRRLMVNAGELLTDLLILCRSDITTGNPNKKARRIKNYDELEKKIDLVEEKDKLRAFQSPVRGEEIMQVCGLKSGPTIGLIKEAIEEAILSGAIANEYEPAKEYFLKIKDKYLSEAKDWEKISS